MKEEQEKEEERHRQEQDGDQEHKHEKEEEEEKYATGFTLPLLPLTQFFPLSRGSPRTKINSCFVMHLLSGLVGRVCQRRQRTGTFHFLYLLLSVYNDSWPLLDILHQYFSL